MATATEPISFARGVPAPECLPEEELADCAREVLERDGKTILSYGSGAGYTPLRELIGEWFKVHPHQVILTNGGLQGFVLLAQHFGRGQTVYVESPTYDRPLKILLENAIDGRPDADGRPGADPVGGRGRASAPTRCRRSSTRSRPSRTRAGARCPRIAAASSSRTRRRRAR